MSSDDGWIIRKNSDEKFVLQHYSASADELPDIANVSRHLRFDTLEEACRNYAERDGKDGWYSEYGLRISIDEITKSSEEESLASLERLHQKLLGGS